MEAGIDFKGLLFTYDEINLDIKVWQGETYKTSYANFTGTDLVTKFLRWRNDLYALCDDGRLLKLIEMNTGTTDTWEEAGDIGEDAIDMVNFKDNIYIAGATQLHYFDGSSITASTSYTIGRTYYSMISVEGYIFLYGDDGTYTTIDRYNGASFLEIWQDTTYGILFDYSVIYNVSGKPLMVDYKGHLYWSYWYNNARTALVKYDISEDKWEEITEIGTIAYVTTALRIYKGMILIAVYDENVSTNASYVYVHVIDKYEKEQVLLPGTGKDVKKLYRVESDPVLPSAHDKERLVYHPSYMCVGLLGGSSKPLFKYGERLECYTDLNTVTGFTGVNLKDTVDQICNILNSYLLVRPENVAEVDIKDMVGKSDIFATLSDDPSYGTLQFSEIKEYIQGENNFRRIVVSWENPLIGEGSDAEMVGVPGALNVDEYSLSSFLVNDPITAKNIAIYLFGTMFSSDGIILDMEYAPFLRNNMNVDFKAISSYLYLNQKKEYKIVKAEHNWQNKTTTLTVLERNIVFKSLEI